MMDLSDVVEKADLAPEVTWLLCTHVFDHQLQLALQSCLDQTFADFEIIVVANGSHSELIFKKIRDFIGNDSRVRVFKTKVKHLPFSLSLGIHEARSCLIARMDSDDISKPFRLEHQVRFMNAHPSVAVLGTAFEVIDEFGALKREVTMPTTDHEIRRALMVKNPFCHPSVIFRRDAVLNVGGYLGGFHAEDYDLWLRLSGEPGLEFANLPDICLSYRELGVSGVRRARSAYASVAASQFRFFMLSGRLVWLAGTIITIIKLLFRTREKK